MDTHIVRTRHPFAFPPKTPAARRHRIVGMTLATCFGILLAACSDSDDSPNPSGACLAKEGTNCYLYCANGKKNDCSLRQNNHFLGCNWEFYEGKTCKDFGFSEREVASRLLALDPKTMIMNLMIHVNELSVAEDLRTRLASNLRDAYTALGELPETNSTQAIKALNAFLDEVAMQPDVDIAETDAQRLINDAEVIVKVLSSPVDTSE